MTDRQARILLVDDDRQTRLRLARELEGAGHVVSSATGGVEALEMARAQPFDLILLDILMPEMDGFQVLEMVQSDPALNRIPVVAISAMEDPEGEEKCLRLGAKRFLTKPIDPAQLNNAIREYL